jgi:hypothetical protein
MASLLTLRLDDKTRQRIARIARRKQLSSSEVVRQAIDAWVGVQEPLTHPFDAMADLIGVVRGGDPKRSERTGRRFTKLLKFRRGVR